MPQARVIYEPRESEDDAMQINLSEKILGRLAGSSKVNPVVMSDLLTFGKDGDIAKELNNLDLSRKIVRCAITINGQSNEIVYLAGQVVAGKLNLHNLSSVKPAPKEKSRYCKSCNQDLPRQQFSKRAHKCISCTKKLGTQIAKNKKIFTNIKKEKKEKKKHLKYELTPKKRTRKESPPVRR